jgi:phage-related tail protein
MAKPQQTNPSVATKQTQPDQRLFKVNSKTYQALRDLLGRQARSNAGLKDLFSRQAPWARPSCKASLKADFNDMNQLG